MRYLSPSRLHRSIRNLHGWGAAVGQTKPSWTVFLAPKLMGVGTDSPTQFREVDDKAFWNRFMRLKGDERPFFDPVEGYRPASYFHNSVFKQRSDRWTTPDYQIIARHSDDLWQFHDGYIARLRAKVLTRAGEVRLFPEPDMIAWLYREEAFPVDTTYQALRDRFRADFHLTPEEIAGLFDEVAFDGEPEDDTYFADRRTSEDLLVEIAKAGEGFDLADALETVAERSGPQPIELEDAVRLAREGRGQVIFQGPPGTGKTYLARQVAASLLGADEALATNPQAMSTFLAQWQASKIGGTDVPDEAPGIWDIVQFHPSYNYEDFVRGISSEIKVDKPEFRVENRTLGQLASTAEATDKPVVLIIDEINRGDLAKVLGELLFALEYRGEAVRTPYALKGSSLLSLPKNLYLLATMNTADRSIALIDYAIRRRFDFVELGASRDTLERFLVNANAGLEVTSRTLDLYDAVNVLLAGDADHLVGHTDFMSTDPQDIARRFVFQVLPLLAEYRREGIIGENVRVRPVGWPREGGVPVVHNRPFDLAEEVAAWLTAP